MPEFLQKFLLMLPAPKDFIMPSRYPRKKSMIAGWMYIGVFVLGIVCLCSNRWAIVDGTTTIDMGYRGNANVTSIGYYNLRHFEVNSTTKVGTSKLKSSESGKITEVPDNKNIGPCSQFIFAWLIIIVILSIPQMIITLYHGWARLNPKAYVASKPKKVCHLGWGCWVFFALTLYQIILLVLHLLDKPNGFVRYESGKVIKDEPKPLKRAASGNYNDAKVTTPTFNHNEPQRQQPSQPAYAKRPAPAQPPRGNAGRANPPPPQPPRGNAGRPKPAVPNRPGRRKMVAIYDCDADQEGDLAFRKGDIIFFVSNEPGDGWITGELNGVQGIFPENYVQNA